MNTRRLFTGLVILSYLWIASCDKQLVSSGYPIVTFNSISSQEGNFVFSAGLMKDKYAKIDETGFVWQIEGDPLLRPGFELRSVVSDSFDATVNFSLKKDKNYTVRAYARCGEHHIYSEQMNFTAEADIPCSLKSFTPDNGSGGDTLIITGKGFNRSLVYNTVFFDNQLSSIIDVTDSILSCIVPSTLQSQGPKTLKILVNGVESTFDTKFTYKFK